MIEHQERATENSRNSVSKAWWEVKCNQWDALPNTKGIRDVLSNLHAHRPTTSFLWDVVQVQTLTLTRGFKGQKVCFPRFTPYYLFMKQRGRDGETWRGRETERNPPARGLWCGKQNLLFNLPSNGIHMTHPELVHTLPVLLLSVVFTCLCLHELCAHTWFLWCPHVCEIGGEWDNMQQIKLAGGEWTKKILVIAPCCCSIALPEK